MTAVYIEDKSDLEDLKYDEDRQRKVDDEMEIKLCRDCQHHMNGHFGSSKCGRTGSMDLVNGGQVFVDCIIERTGISGTKDCGPTAKFFSPKIKVAA